MPDGERERLRERLCPALKVAVTEAVDAVKLRVPEREHVAVAVAEGLRAAVRLGLRVRDTERDGVEAVGVGVGVSVGTAVREELHDTVRVRVDPLREAEGLRVREGLMVAARLPDRVRLAVPERVTPGVRERVSERLSVRVSDADHGGVRDPVGEGDRDAERLRLRLREMRGVKVMEEEALTEPVETVCDGLVVPEAEAVLGDEETVQVQLQERVAVSGGVGGEGVADGERERDKDVLGLRVEDGDPTGEGLRETVQVEVGVRTRLGEWVREEEGEVEAERLGLGGDGVVEGVPVCGGVSDGLRDAVPVTLGEAVAGEGVKGRVPEGLPVMDPLEVMVLAERDVVAERVAVADAELTVCDP